MFFRDRHPGYDDGMYVGLRVQEMLSQSDKSLNEMVKTLHLYYNTEEIKVRTTDDLKFSIVDKVRAYCDTHQYTYNTIDGIKVFSLRDGL